MNWLCLPIHTAFSTPSFPTGQLAAYTPTLFNLLRPCLLAGILQIIQD
jgi:hypothetical protein